MVAPRPGVIVASRPVQTKTGRLQPAALVGVAPCGCGHGCFHVRPWRDAKRGLAVAEDECVGVEEAAPVVVGGFGGVASGGDGHSDGEACV